MDFPIELIHGHSHEAMAAADVVLLASGTVTLEALLLKKPMVVAYKLAPLSHFILSRLVKSPWISLPNLLAQKMLVPELIQEKATPEALCNGVMNYFENPDEAQQLIETFTAMHLELKRDASVRAADAVAQLIRKMS